MAVWDACKPSSSLDLRYNHRRASGHRQVTRCCRVVKSGTLHLDAMSRNFIQGDLTVSDYCRKMKSMTDFTCAVFNYNLILNILQG
jgi:hypothetical protein